MVCIHFIICSPFRSIVDSAGRKQQQDISRPVKNSFVHTGHGSPFGKSWGNPGFLEESYLKDPSLVPKNDGMLT